MNACFNHCYIPVELLKGDINPIIKDTKGNSTDPANYRPVMLSSCLLKIFEMHILDILEEKLFFDFRQLGFSKQMSTNDAYFTLRETVTPYIKGYGKAFAAFIDLSKAFDRINHNILGNMLLERGIPPDIVFTLMTYLRNQKARIVWNKQNGNYHYINSGVRQGGILSPILFKLYVDDVFKTISSMNVGCRLGTLRMNIIAYADDIVILSDNRSNLECLLEMFENKVQAIRLSINASKTKCIIFHRKAKSAGSDTISFIRQFEIVNCQKYLGYWVTHNFCDKKDVEIRLNTFYSKFNSVYRKFKGLNTDTMLYLFKACCVPDYGLQLWDNETVFSSHIFKTFETAYAKAMKRIIRCPVHASNHA